MPLVADGLLPTQYYSRGRRAHGSPPASRVPPEAALSNLPSRQRGTPGRFVGETRRRAAFHAAMRLSGVVLLFHSLSIPHLTPVGADARRVCVQCHATRACLTMSSPRLLAARLPYARRHPSQSFRRHTALSCASGSSRCGNLRGRSFPQLNPPATLRHGRVQRLCLHLNLASRRRRSPAPAPRKRSKYLQTLLSITYIGNTHCHH